MSGCLRRELSGLDTIRHQTSVEFQLGAWERDRFLKPPAVAARLCIDKSLVLSCLDIFCEGFMLKRRHFLAAVLIAQLSAAAFAQQPRTPITEPPPPPPQQPKTQPQRPEDIDVVRITTNLVQVDGADNTDNSVNASRSTVSQEAVQEFQVVTNSFAPEFGRSSDVWRLEGLHDHKRATPLQEFREFFGRGDLI